MVAAEGVLLLDLRDIDGRSWLLARTGLAVRVIDLIDWLVGSAQLIVVGPIGVQ
jgi:hypothetical protein